MQHPEVCAPREVLQAPADHPVHTIPRDRRLARPHRRRGGIVVDRGELHLDRRVEPVWEHVDGREHAREAPEPALVAAGVIVVVFVDVDVVDRVAW